MTLHYHGTAAHSPAAPTHLPIQPKHQPPHGTIPLAYVCHIGMLSEPGGAAR